MERAAGAKFLGNREVFEHFPFENSHFGTISTNLPTNRISSKIRRLQNPDIWTSQDLLRRGGVKFHRGGVKFDGIALMAELDAFHNHPEHLQSVHRREQSYFVDKKIFFIGNLDLDLGSNHGTDLNRFILQALRK